MNENLGLFTFKHLTPFSYYHNGVNYTVGGNKYNAFADIEVLLSQISGSMIASQMIEALPIAQKKIAQSSLPGGEKAEWASYLVSYVDKLDDPTLIQKARALLKLGGEAVS